MASTLPPVTVEAVSGVEVVGWFPDDARQIWVKVTVGDESVIRRVEIPKPTRAGVAF